MLRVAVGSKNPVKIEAAREVFSSVFGDVSVVPVEAKSGVPNQPINEQAVKGATNRAVQAIRKAKADYGVGIEGGMVEFNGNSYFTGFCVIVDRKGKKGTGTSGWFECPPAILPEIKSGKELGEVTDMLYSKKDTKKNEGAIGIWTKGNVSRKELYKHGLHMAIIRYLNTELWNKE